MLVHMLNTNSAKDHIVLLSKRISLTCFISLMVCLPIFADNENDNTHIVVNAEWLYTQILEKNNKLKILDVRTKTVFANGHIPGAINFPVEKSFDGSRIVSLRGFRLLMRKLGIKNSDILILYDNGYIRNAAHVFWVLETYGHEQVAVLDGGVPVWKKQGGELSKQVTDYPASIYTPSMSKSHLATKLGTRLAIDNPNVTIIDSRTNQEYRGIDTKAVRAGHIPNAVNFYAADNIDNSNGVPELKGRHQLQTIYSSVNKSNQVMTYCNRGKDSAMTYFIMRYLDYKVSVYDGGWLEWGNDLHLPIEK